MVESLNLDNIRVDKNGRVSFSGIGSGIDFATAVDNIITARRVPVDRMEAKVETNDEKLTAFSDLRNLLQAFQDSVDGLRGKVSFQNAGNDFEAKSSFASTTRADTTSPSAAGELLGVSVTNQAQAGSHSIEILQTAQAHKIASGTGFSASDDIGLAFAGSSGSLFGAFEVNGKRIEIENSDTLIDIADRFNVANKGNDATGVSASVVQVSETEHILVLTASETGETMEFSVLDQAGSGVADSLDTELGAAFGSPGSFSGTFEINGSEITVATTDKLQDLVDNINAVSDDTKVTASIKNNVDGTYELLLTATESGATITLGNDSGTLLADLGLSADGGATLQNHHSAGTDILQSLGISGDGGATFDNELRVARKALFKVDGLLDSSAAQSAGFATATAALSTYGVAAGSIDIATPTAGTVSIANVDTKSLNTIRDEINADSDLQAAGISASVVTDSDGEYHLKISQSDITITDSDEIRGLRLSDPDADAEVGGSTLTFAMDSGTLSSSPVTLTVADGASLNDIADQINADASLIAAGVSATVIASGGVSRLEIIHDAKIDATGPASLGLDQPELEIERSSNTVDDVIKGVTISLFKAEEGTTINLDVEQDLSGVKDGIIQLVDTYNALRSFINEQRLTDERGQKSEDAGPLFGNAGLANIESSLARIIGDGAKGLSEGLRALSEIGVSFVSNDSISDPLLADTLEIDESELDDALINDPDGVEKLFAFSFSSSDPRIALLSSAGTTKVADGGYEIDVTYKNGILVGATINGVEGSATVSGNVITATNKTDAYGLSMLYNGSTSVSGITVDFSQGVASSLFFELDRILEEETGTLDVEVQTLSDTNEALTDRIDTLLERLDSQRLELLGRYQRMESALLTLNSTLESLKQQFEAMTGGS